MFKITIEDIMTAVNQSPFNLCRGAYGYQVDPDKRGTGVGYSHLCGLSILESGDPSGEIRNDARIPAREWDIRTWHLPVFAEWQRKIRARHEAQLERKHETKEPSV